MFKHKLGSGAISKTTAFTGMITARSENLYGCHRYFLQPKTDKDGKLPDGYWFDEEDLEITSDVLAVEREKDTATTKPGGPISSIR